MFHSFLLNIDCTNIKFVFNLNKLILPQDGVKIKQKKQSHRLGWKETEENRSSIHFCSCPRKKRKMKFFCLDSGNESFMCQLNGLIWYAQHIMDNKVTLYFQSHSNFVTTPHFFVFFTMKAPTTSDH